MRISSCGTSYLELIKKGVPHTCGTPFTISEFAFNSAAQVFWLSDHSTFHTFPLRLNETVAFVDFVPDHSGGTATDLHRVPDYAMNIYSLFLVFL